MNQTIQIKMWSWMTWSCAECWEREKGALLRIENERMNKQCQGSFTCHHLHKSHNLTCGPNIFQLTTSSTSSDVEIWLFVEAHQHLRSLIARKLKTHSNCKVICGVERGSREDGHQMLPVNCPVKSAHWVSCKMNITVCCRSTQAQINLIIIWLASISFLQLLTCSTASTEEVTRQTIRFTWQTAGNQILNKLSLVGQTKTGLEK